MTCGESEPGGNTRQHAAPPEDEFLNRFLGAVALDTALKAGVIEKMAQQGQRPLSVLGLPPRAARILAAILVDNGICEYGNGGESGDRCVGLTTAFTRVFSTRRKFLDQKLSFLLLAARDLLDGLPDLLFDLPTFMERSETFALFRYDKAVDPTPENLSHTRRWTDYVTALTETEAEALISEFDIEGCERMLEVGGNTGAFSLRLLQRFPDLKASVLDLPVVCRLGEEYVRGKPGAGRLRFFAGDARRDPWPLVSGRAADLIVFKSVLHDWPESETGMMLDRAKSVLAPGGRVIVCERGPLEDEISSIDPDDDFVCDCPSSCVSRQRRAALACAGAVDCARDWEDGEGIFAWEPQPPLIPQ